MWITIDLMPKSYPSQIRYEKAHPTVSFRLQKDEKARIKQLALEAGKSFPQYIKDILVEAENHSDAYRKGLIEGYDKGRNDFQIWYFCKICEKRINIKPNSDSHKAVIEHMKEVGWGHSECYHPAKENPIHPE